MLLYVLHQKSEEDAKNMHPACICILTLCMWDQYQTTIWILESAVPSCLGNMNQSFPSTDFLIVKTFFCSEVCSTSHVGRLFIKPVKPIKALTFDPKNMKNSISQKKKEAHHILVAL